MFGCMTAAERQVMNNRNDHNTCISYGAKQGTTAYTDCRMNLNNTRNQRQQRASQNLYNMGMDMYNNATPKY